MQATLNPRSKLQKPSQRIPKQLIPNWQIAKQHGKASKIGKCDNQSSIGKICECCFEHIDKQQIPLMQSTKELEFLGFGFPLYFSFLRNCMFLLFITICSYNIIALHNAITANSELCSGVGNMEAGVHNLIKDSQNLDRKYVHSHLRNFKMQANILASSRSQINNQLPTKVILNNHLSSSKSSSSRLQCTSWMIFVSSINPKLTQFETGIRVTTYLIHIFMLIYIRQRLIKMKEYFDERTTSPSDFAVMMTDLNQKAGQKSMIKKIISNQYGIKEIAEVLLIPHLLDFEKLTKKKREILERMKKKIKKEEFDKEMVDLEKNNESIDMEIRQLITKAKMLYRSDQLVTQKAIIIINTERERIELLQKFEAEAIKAPGWQKAQISEIGEPKQIIWKNAGLSSNKRKVRILFGWSLSLLLLIFLTLLFAFLSKLRSDIVLSRLNDYKANNQEGVFYLYQAKFLFYGMILFVVLLNKLVISNYFHYFTDLERHSSTAKFQFSFCLKYCLGLFFTTALMTLLIEGLVLKNYYEHDYGLIEEETIMFIFVSIFSSVFWAVNFGNLKKKIQRARLYGTNGITQSEANQLMQDPQYDVGKRYAEILKIMWISFLYETLVPVGGIISLIGLAAYYWVDKYNLLRVSSIKSNVSGDLIYLTLRLLDMTIVLRVFGEMIFDYQIKHSVSYFSIVCLLLAIGFQFVPISKVLELINHQNFNLEAKTYMEARYQFHETYYNNHVLFSKLDEDRAKLGTYLTNNFAISRKSFY